jgi:hypothetical protein
MLMAENGDVNGPFMVENGPFIVDFAIKNCTCDNCDFP